MPGGQPLGRPIEVDGGGLAVAQREHPHVDLLLVGQDAGHAGHQVDHLGPPHLLGQVAVEVLEQLGVHGDRRDRGQRGQGYEGVGGHHLYRALAVGSRRQPALGGHVPRGDAHHVQGPQV